MVAPIVAAATVAEVAQASGPRAVQAPAKAVILQTKAAWGNGDTPTQKPFDPDYERTRDLARRLQALHQEHYASAIKLQWRIAAINELHKALDSLPPAPQPEPKASDPLAEAK